MSHEDLKTVCDTVTTVAFMAFAFGLFYILLKNLL